MKAWMKACAVPCLALLTGWPLVSPAQNTHTLPLVRPADFAGQESLVRIVNRSDTSGTVQVNAFDDVGDRFGPVSLALGARETVTITSRTLESGSAGVGLPVGIGDGEGNWRLELATALTIDALTYIRTPDKFMTSMHDVAPVLDGSHWVPFFNPGSNTSKVSHLRIINPGTAAAEVTVTGRDDAGDAASGTVRLTLPAGAARTLTAQQLEAGGAGFDGSLGDGAGKWTLNVNATADVHVMSLLSSHTGHLTNLSTTPGGTVRGPGETEEVFRRYISEPVVQSKCVRCHVAGGLSGHTRLVFVRSSNPDHLALNLQAFKDFFAEVEGAAEWILNKIQGVGHGGGIQVSAGTLDYANMERFLTLLRGGGPPVLRP